MAATSPSDFSADDRAFTAQWNGLERADRLRLRRLVRTGRRVDEPKLAPLAGPYARHQLERPWVRFFWFWYLPGLVIALGIASQIHPIALGAVLALGGQGAWAHVSIRRAARVAPS